jgi:RimJ/RimL family protein N-acetyltransferase
MSSRVPASLGSERLLLRCWRPDDAPRLLPVLEANASRLATWIPARVAAPAPPADLEERLATFMANFEADREWRYALFSPDEQTILGEVSLFPRSAAGRVSLEQADRLEIGYWLRSEATGQALATEAAAAMLAVARSLPGMRQVEIRCDARNEPSAAVPRRLGFRLSAARTASPGTPHEPAPTDQLWEMPLAEHWNR